VAAPMVKTIVPCDTLVTRSGAGRVLLVFIDGVGVGDDDAAVNAFAAAALPTFDALLDGTRPFKATLPVHARRASAVALDATLGVPGTPQSGTGQTALFTGRNAAQLFGRHFGPWVPTELRVMLGADSVLARVWGAGLPVAFANAYPEELVAAAARPAPSGARRLPPFLRAAPPLAALGIGALDRHAEALARGDAVASEITNDGWRERLGRTELPVITARQAGHNLAAIARAHALTLFAHYSTDYAGHRQELPEAVAALERVDAFLGGVVERTDPDTLIVVTSDHGNLEDARVGHTLNPALCLVIGNGAAGFAAPLRSLMDVAPAIVAWVTGAPAVGISGSDSSP
jgi:2,3-bisphosphoglycerate-independent phosphoglycerate mutase